MSLISTVNDGLSAAVGALPANPYLTSVLVAAGAGVMISTGWNGTNPEPLTAGDLPVLSPPRRPSPTVDDVAAAPLEIPLDTVPRDGDGRTPYDVVGADTLRAAVDTFYSKVVADAELSHFFTTVDMPMLKRHQALFIGQLWGGPVNFPLERLAGAHDGLGISADQYWRVAGHLMTTLTHLRVPDWICTFTMSRLYQVRTMIIAETTGATAIVAPAPEA